MPVVRALLDLAGLVQVQHQRMVAALADGAGVASERVVLTYSHTHSSGWFVPDRMPFPGGELIEPYIETLASRLRGAAREGVAALEDATITYGTGRSDMGANRDYTDDAHGLRACGFNPDAPCDDTVVVARATAEDGRLLLTLVNYACHPTTLAWENTLISPDYPGALRETVEHTTGAPCVFAQGMCGDIGPRRGFSGATQLADRNGEQAGYAALSALSGMSPAGADLTYAGPVVSGATLGTWHDTPHDAGRAEQTERFAGGTFTVELPLKPRPDREQLRRELAEWEGRQRQFSEAENAGAARDAGAHAERARRWLARLEDLPPGDAYPLTCSAYRLGDAVWVACGGEPYSALQIELRRRCPDLTVIASPLMGDLQVAYLLTEEAYGTGRYQEEPSILAPGCLERLTDAIAARIDALS